MKHKIKVHRTGNHRIERHIFPTSWTFGIWWKRAENDGRVGVFTIEFGPLVFMIKPLMSKAMRKHMNDAGYRRFDDWMAAKREARKKVTENADVSPIR